MKLKDYKGLEIEVSESSRFSVTLATGEVCVGTLEEVQTRIDAEIARDAKRKRTPVDAMREGPNGGLVPLRLTSVKSEYWGKRKFSFFSKEGTVRSAFHFDQSKVDAMNKLIADFNAAKAAIMASLKPVKFSEVDPEIEDVE